MRMDEDRVRAVEDAEVPAALGLDPMLGRWSLYRILRGEAPETPPARDYREAGREATVRAVVEDEALGVAARRPKPGTVPVRHPQLALCARPHFVLPSAPQYGEGHAVGFAIAIYARQWRTEWYRASTSAEPPPPVHARAQAMMMCTRAKWCMVAVHRLWSPRGPLAFAIAFDGPAQDRLTEALAAFHEEVLCGHEPAPDARADAHALASLGAAGAERTAPQVLAGDELANAKAALARYRDAEQRAQGHGAELRAANEERANAAAQLMGLRAGAPLVVDDEEVRVRGEPPHPGKTHPRLQVHASRRPPPR